MSTYHALVRSLRLQVPVGRLRQREHVRGELAKLGPVVAEDAGLKFEKKVHIVKWENKIYCYKIEVTFPSV